MRSGTWSTGRPVAATGGGGGQQALHFEVEAALAELAPARARLRRWLTRRADVPAPVVDELVLAVDEALTNAIEHGHADADPACAVSIRAEDDGHEIRVVIRDHGRWRTPPPPGDRGRGLAIMLQLLDRVEVRIHASGTTVTLARSVR